MNLQNVLNTIIGLQGIDVTIKELATGTDYSVKAAIANYFRTPVFAEEIESSGRSYVISSKDLPFLPRRGDRFTISSSQYFSISDVQEMVVFGNIIGYRLFLK